MKRFWNIISLENALLVIAILLTAIVGLSLMTIGELTQF